MSEEINEANPIGCPNVIPLDCSKEIINQMEKDICKIKVEKQGTGFFCKIPFPDKDHMLKVLITNNHIINEDILYKKDAKISIFIKEEKKYKELNLNDRIKYTNKEEEYDITIIEIKENDGINNFLELDDKIINDIITNQNENDDYIDKTFYVIQYPEGELSVSFGILSSIFNDKKYKFKHKCSTKRGSSGSPISTLKNKVIGIHRSSENFNIGTFLNEPISDFIKLYNNKDGDKNIIGNKINEIFLEEINNKFNLDINNIDRNIKLIEKSLGNDGYKELQELFLYYNSKITSSYSLHLDINFHKKVIKQMENSICNIKRNDGASTTGFLCKIPFPDKDHMLEVLITINHFLNEDKLYKKDAKISIFIKEEKKYKELDLNDRIKYTNREYDITIIEIKPNRDNIHNFLELDEKILNDIINNEIKDYEYSSIYQVYYSKENLLVSYGMIYDSYEENKFNFKYKIFVQYGGAQGSPILDLNNKVIGIYVAFDRKSIFRHGHFLNYPIIEFIQKNYYKNNNRNEISIKKNDNFNLIKKYLGQDIFEKLNKLYLSFKITFPSRFYISKSSFSLENYERIINQMENNIYKIKVGNREAVGFSCKIPFPNKDNLLKVFITNNSILNEDILNKKNENILINLNGENKLLNLSNRKKYSSKEYNTTIIEVKDDDEIKNYLDIDDDIINHIGNNEKQNYLNYNHQAIYMIKNESGTITTTYSIIENLFIDTHIFMFRINKKNEPLEGPIFSKESKLIGIRNHFQSFKGENMCCGTFLNYPIKEFNQKFCDIKIKNNL